MDPALNAGEAYRRTMSSPPFLRGAELLSILQTGRAFTAAELATQMEISERTVWRYVAELRKIDYRIESSRGHYGSIRMEPGEKMPPLTFTDEEFETIYAALAWLLMPNNEYYDRASALSHRLRRIIPPEKLHQYDAVSSHTFRQAIQALQGN